MANITSAGHALVNTIAEICRGLALGYPVKVYQGWPNPEQLKSDLASNPEQLKSDLASNAVHISVFPRPGSKVTSVLTGEGEWEEHDNDGTRGTVMREVRRETRQFQVTVWANCFDRRDPLANTIDPELSALSRIMLDDGSQATIAYISSLQDDDNQNIGVYRRDFFYAINYGVYQTQSAWAIAQVQANCQVVEAVSHRNSAIIGEIHLIIPKETL